MDISSVNDFSSSVSAPADRSLPQPANADQRALIQAVKSVNAAELLGQDKELTVVKDRATKRIAVRIISKDTGDIVAQIPAEDVLRMAEEVNGG